MSPIDQTTAKRILTATISFVFVMQGTRHVVAAEINKGGFRIAYDDRGVTGLANPQDPFAAQVLPRGQRLAVAGKFRTDPAAAWIELGTMPTTPHASPDGAGIAYQSSAQGEPFKLSQVFSTDGDVLDWTLDLEATSDKPVEVGDLAIVLPWQRPAGQDAKAIFEQGFCKHQFIAGHGSFLYFTRASGVPPYLVVSVLPGTKLEYSTAGVPGGRGGGPGGFQAFIHSAVTGSAETRGTWRQPHTSLRLGPAGSKDAKVRYGFRLQWAKSYDQMREVLFKEGLFDIRVIPGMTVPEDLTARFALHTKAKIDAIEPEFPEQTKVASLGEARPGYHLYEVQFKRLGENLLTIRHDGGRKTILEFFACEPLETLIKKRSAFIAFHQQRHDPGKWYDGLFSVYDMRNKVLRSPDDNDGWTGRNGYILACDDPGLCKAPYVASKNVHFPVPDEIHAVEHYLEHFVWGGLQRTDKENPYPYGIYGIPNWKVQRDPALRTTFERDVNRRPDLLPKTRVWRSYDYAHVTMLYFHMYEVARKYPAMTKYLDAAGYLERAYQTARGYYTYPYEILPNDYNTYTFGVYNELVILNLIDALEKEGRPKDAAWLRAEWEKKTKYFVYDNPYPYRSEYAFDRTAFESTYALAKYGATHDMQPDKDLWFDVKARKSYSHPSVKQEDSRAFMDRQLLANLAVRGWLEHAYYLLGADFTGSSDRGAMSYMAQMGGWGIFDYGVNFAPDPADWLQLGYASYLGAWSLMNTGREETGYGFWFPGKENDGASGWSFMTAKFGRAWIGKDESRGPWHYDGEIDLGYGGALRTAATVLTRDPVFDWLAYGGELTRGEKGSISVIPRDGLRQRFFAVLGEAGDPTPPPVRRFKVELDRDGFAAGRPIVTDPALGKIEFTIENRTGDDHTTGVWLSVPAGSSYQVLQAGKAVDLASTGNWDYPLRAELRITGAATAVEVARQPGPVGN